MQTKHANALSKGSRPNASALSGKTKPMPARYSNSKVAVNRVTQHLNEVQIERQKQAVAGLGVSRVRDPAVNPGNINL